MRIAQQVFNVQQFVIEGTKGRFGAVCPVFSKRTHEKKARRGVFPPLLILRKSPRGGVSARGLYETRDCLFLDDLRVLGKETLDKKAIEGGREEELKDFLEEKCGKVFQKLDLPA